MVCLFINFFYQSYFCKDHQFNDQQTISVLTFVIHFTLQDDVFKNVIILTITIHRTTILLDTEIYVYTVLCHRYVNYIAVLST